MADTIIKKWNGSTFDEVYPRTTHTQIVATGTPSSTTFLRGDGSWEVPAVASHSHGNLSNTGGWNTSPATISSGDLIIINDGDGGGLRQSSLAFGSGTTTFLRNDGTWASPASDPFLYDFLESDTLKENSTYTTDLEIANLEANSYYEVHLIAGHYKDTTTSAGIRVAFVLSNTIGSPTFAATTFITQYSTTSVGVNQIYAIGSSVISGSIVSSTITTTTATNRMLTVDGILYTGTSLKTLRVQTSQSTTTSGTGVGLLAGSVLKVRKIN